MFYTVHGALGPNVLMGIIYLLLLTSQGRPKIIWAALCSDMRQNGNAHGRAHGSLLLAKGTLLSQADVHSPSLGWGEKQEAGGKRDVCCCLQLLFFPQKSSTNPQSISHWFLMCLVNCKHDQHQGQAAGAGLTPHVFIKESQCSFTPEILMCWNKVGAKQDYILASSDAFMQKTVYTKGANFNLRM